MMLPKICGNLPGGTIDGHFMEQACPHRDRYHFVEDSDEFCCYSITPYDEVRQLVIPGRYSEEALAAYIMGRAQDIGKQHLLFARRIFRFHTGDLDETWATVEAESTRVLTGIFRHLGINQSRQLSQAQWAQLFRHLLQPNPSSS